MKLNPRLLLVLALALLLGIVALLVPLAHAAPAAQDNGPVVIIDRPPSNSIYNEGDPINVESTSSSAVGIVQVDLYADNTLVDTDLTPNNQPQIQFKLISLWKSASAGQHTLTVRAIDSENQKAEAAIIVIVQSKTPSPTPTPTLLPQTPILSTATPGPEQCTLNSRFVADITIPDNTVVAPGGVFTKVWALQNNGTCAWTAGFTAVWISGERMDGATPSPIVPAVPLQTINVSINFIAPTVPGTHISYWQLQAANGVKFGTTFYVKVIVPGQPTAVPLPTATPLPPPPPPAGCQGAPQITSFTATNYDISEGQETTLQWGKVYNADYASLNTAAGNSGVATPGQQNVRPRQTTTYVLNAFCKGYRVQSQLTVRVRSNPPPPTRPPQQPNQIQNIQVQKQGNTFQVTVKYWWNGSNAPANMQGVGTRNGDPVTNRATRDIIAGFVKFVTLTLSGKNVQSIDVCMIGRGGVELVCSSANAPR